MKINKFLYFYPEKPKLIHIDQPLFQSLSDKKEWVAERKYNGSRLQLHCLNGEFDLWNRHEQKLDYRPSDEILEELRKLVPNKGYYLFDGELRDRKTIGIRNKIILYDVFICNNELLVGQPFWYRRNILKKYFKCNAEPIGITEQFKDNFMEVFNKVTYDDEIEGLVIKNTRGVLNLGRTGAVKSDWMVKVRKPSGRYKF